MHVKNASDAKRKPPEPTVVMPEPGKAKASMQGEKHVGIGQN